MKTRREFLEMATVAATAWAGTAWSTESKGDIPYRSLGRTGEKVSIIGVGGYHLGKSDVDPQEATRIVQQGLDEGINFLDNCWDYNGGESESRMGRALGGNMNRGCSIRSS